MTSSSPPRGSPSLSPSLPGELSAALVLNAAPLRRRAAHSSWWLPLDGGGKGLRIPFSPPHLLLPTPSLARGILRLDPLPSSSPPGPRLKRRGSFSASLAWASKGGLGGDRFKMQKPSRLG